MTIINEKLKGWRTVIVNILMAILPILQLTEFAQVLPSEWLPYYALAMALANMWMRSITTTPMGKST